MGRIEWEGTHESGRGHCDMNILFESGTATTTVHSIKDDDAHRMWQI